MCCVPLSLQELEEQSAGAAHKPEMPTLMLPVIKKGGGGQATGYEAMLHPLESPENSTGAVLSSFLHLSGVTELESAPDTEAIKKGMRMMLASLRRAVTYKKVAEWTEAWQATTWPERKQDVLWPPYVAPARVPESGRTHKVPLMLGCMLTGNMVRSLSNSINSLFSQAQGLRNIAPD